MYLTKRLFSGLALAALATGAAWAQAAFPSKPLVYVVPYAPGGAADVFARQLSERLALRLGQSVVVDNRAGANGNIGSASILRAPADGHVLLLGTASTIAINPHLYGAAMPYDTVKDLQAVSGTHAMVNVLVVNADAPYKSVKDVIAAAKAKPASLAYASAGNGNTMHIAGEQFRMQAGIELIHVPYKGGAPAMNDVLSGQVPMMFNNLPAVLPLVRAGKLRALAVTGASRSPALPEVPTIAESGYPGFEASSWSGLFMPAGTPPGIVSKLSAAVAQAYRQPELLANMKSRGFELASLTPEEFTAFVTAQRVKWAKVIRDANIRIEQ